MQKLTINRVALGSIRRRRGQYRAMIIGAGLAIFFVSSLFLAVQSVYETYRLNHVARVGDMDAIIRDAERIAPEALLDSGLVNAVGSVYVLGETEGTNCPIGYFDEPGAQMALWPLMEGRMPDAACEIAVEPDFLQRQRLDAQIGDEIELSLKIPRGVDAEFLPETVKKTYTLVGILRPRSAYVAGNKFVEDEYLHYPNAIVSGDSLVEPGGRALLHHMVRLSPGTRFQALEDWAAIEYGLRNTIPTGFLLIGLSDKNFEANSDGLTMVAIACVLGAVLVLAACLGIVNAFSASLSGRRSQIGMMRAVGATGRQIRSLFGREALLLAAATAVPAIALSHLFVWMLAGRISSVTFHSNIWFLPLDFAAAMLCVALAAWIPLRRASKLPPMQAIRDVSLLRARRRIRVREMMLYDAPRLIARRHLQLYKVRQSGIAIMVALSMLLIAIGVPFVMGLWTYKTDYAYEIAGYGGARDNFVETNMNPHQGLNGADIQEVMSLPLVDRVDSIAEVQINLLMDRVSQYAAIVDWKWNETEQYSSFRTELGLTKEVLNSGLYGCNEDFIAALTPYVVSGKIDIDQLNAGREVLVFAPDVYYYWQTVTEDSISSGISLDPIKTREGVKTLENDTYRAGDVLPILRLHASGELLGTEEWRKDHITGVIREEAAPVIGAVLNGNIREGMYSMMGSLTIGDLITTHEGLASMGFSTLGVSRVGIRLSAAPDDMTHAYLTDTLKNIAARGMNMELYNNIGQERESKFWQAVVRLCLLALMLLLLSMCVSLVNNAITGRVRSEKRAIGTLRAVGAQLSGIVRSYRLQALAMVVRGIASGAVLSGLYYIWYYSVPNPIELMPVRIGPVLLFEAAFLAAVALFCGINLSLRIREITRESIVSNIREL